MRRQDVIAIPLIIDQHFIYFGYCWDPIGTPFLFLSLGEVKTIFKTKWIIYVEKTS
jgi:hypothetical protein